MRLRRGATFVEALMASLIMSMALAGMFGLWTVCSLRIQSAGEISEAGELARAELERAKAFGASNFPLGTLISGSTGSWAGSFDPTLNSGVGNWSSGHIEYYDLAGNRVASDAATVRFSLQVSVTDSGVLSATGNTYTLEVTSRRGLTVTIRRLPDNTVLFKSGTNLVIGGL